MKKKRIWPIVWCQADYGIKEQMEKNEFSVLDREGVTDTLQKAK